MFVGHAVQHLIHSSGRKCSLDKAFVGHGGGGGGEAGAGRNIGHLGIGVTMYSHVAKSPRSKKDGVKTHLPKKGGRYAEPSWRASPQIRP